MSVIIELDELPLEGGLRVNVLGFRERFFLAISGPRAPLKDAAIFGPYDTRDEAAGHARALQVERDKGAA